MKVSKLIEYSYRQGRELMKRHSIRHYKQWLTGEETPSLTNYSAKGVVLSFLYPMK